MDLANLILAYLLMSCANLIALDGEELFEYNLPLYLDILTFQSLLKGLPFLSVL